VKERMYVKTLTLYKADWTPVMLTEEDAHYRDAYRRLFVQLEEFPPDGEYEYDGKRLRWAKPLPLTEGV